MTSGKIKGSTEANIFEQVIAIHQLHIAPRYLGDLQLGAMEHLDRRLLKFSRELGGIPLAYSKVEINHNQSDESSSAPILFENPCIHVAVKVYWTVFCPRVGMRLQGVVNQWSGEHLSLLLFNYFNATIYASQMEASLRWNEEEQVWQRPGDREDISLGSQIEFEALDLIRESGLTTIVGSLDRLLV